MDTISREPSPSYLPIAGLIAGLVGLLLGGIALANASKAGKAAAAAAEQAAGQVARIEALEGRIDGIAANSDTALRNFTSLRSSMQENFNVVAAELGKSNAEITKLQEAFSKVGSGRSAPSSGGASAPAVAGPGEYLVKAGDTGMKISAANGVSWADLQSVNPGVNWNGLRVGQALKLPKK
jgi:nucleoid-associated protein YgaU